MSGTLYSTSSRNPEVPRGCESFHAVESYETSFIPSPRSNWEDATTPAKILEYYSRYSIRNK